ncbi:carbohydrate ABC transporter permease [Terrarubrum flagellatum]|uniref:carbohydrate ABC transporter permease n=1 Tax=Terrirubrum flagellatum TaxID=2895980 RepID=UPI0031454BBB
MSAKSPARAVGFYLLVAAIILYATFPFLWAIITSLKEGSAIGAGFWPTKVTLQNYRELFSEQPFLANIVNSLVVAAAVSLVSIALALIAAYPLSRLRFKGRRAMLLAILGVSMFPQIAVLAGLFEIIRALGLYNSLSGLVLANLILVLPFAAWVLTNFMRDIAVELEDAAIVDGAGPVRIALSVFAPLMAPAMAAVGLLTFITAWNEFLFALTFTLTPDKRTVPVAIALITGATAYETPWGRIMAASVIVTLPLIALVLILQRRIVAGLSAGSVKG